jgi:homocysteine S-methyltransferase
MLTKQELLDFIQTRRALFSDGAMGTVLNQRLPASQACLDCANLSYPDVIASVHNDYLTAGSDMIQTNTFGANHFKLAAQGLEDQLVKINKTAVEIAQQAVNSSGRSAFIAGDIGPLGVRLAPFGRVQLPEAREAFARQIAALVEAGADLLILETITDLYEIVEAIQAARQVAGYIPVIASMTYTRDNRTLLGDPPAKVARRLYDAGADAIGVNCSGGPNQILNILRMMRQAVPDALYSVMPNAGWPEQVEGRIMYPRCAGVFRSVRYIILAGRREHHRRLLRYHPGTYQRHGQHFQ